MYLLQTLIALATTASAIDITFYSGGGCSGISINCPAINPDVCCSIESFPVALNSIAYRFVPTNWHIESRGYDQPRCANQRLRGSIQGTDYACYTQGGWSWKGAGYGFINKKRDSGAQNDDTVDSQSCKSSQQPTVLTLLDGVKYDIAELAKESLDELV